ncbi:NADP-dependent oxidoreductase domain-containing protein [Desarmillaria tabescens]|uniref:NADP-dependent oxidoreductase domain-containing protein n=1 Tax=Armillaria tabescens TaxID=1929756 RepID=A0AA39KER5_ARMTA|nr:NADP-dependent oxidoreductase domain-containing protein [Desarmillaria tabescens]KAK0459824.1 NADP-dependent oxidoreductase domain-containing protein [Desarmillaria tabescens]
MSDSPGCYSCALQFDPTCSPTPSTTAPPFPGSHSAPALLSISRMLQRPVRVAIENGVTHLDGAQMYENEDSLGAGIKASGKPRSELYVTTKLKSLAEGQTIKDTLVISLKKLGLEYVDLFLIHDPTSAKGELKAWWKQMEEVKSQGLTKSIGISNFRVEDMKEVIEVATILPAIEFHPYVFKAAEPIYKYALEHKILIASYGGLTPIVRAPGGPVDPVVNGIAERLKISPSQVYTKWLLQKGILVVTTTSKPARITETLKTPDVTDLTSEDIAAIEEAGAKLHKRIFMRHVFGEA